MSSLEPHKHSLRGFLLQNVYNQHGKSREDERKKVKEVCYSYFNDRNLVQRDMLSLFKNSHSCKGVYRGFNT